MSLITELLPRVATTYKSAAFDLEDKIRPIFLKHGLYITVEQLEDALATVYAVGHKLGNHLLEDDVKVIVVEKKKSVIPIGGIAVASLLSVPVLSIGEGLKLPKIDDDYYNEAIQLLDILPLDPAKTWIPHTNQWLMVVTYDIDVTRSSWFRYTNSDKKYVIYLGPPPNSKTMKYVHSTNYSYCKDKQFSDGNDRVIQYWYEDNTLDTNWPERD